MVACRPSVPLVSVFVASAMFLVSSAAAAESPIKAGDKVKVIKGPAPVKVGKKTLTTVDTGAELTGLKVHGNWVKVAVQKGAGKITGWIHSKHLEVTAQGHAATDPGESSSDVAVKAGDRIQVKSGPAPIRVGKKTLTNVEAGTKFTALKVQGEWINVSIKRRGKELRGWIHQRYIKRTRDESATPARSDTPPEQSKEPRVQKPRDLKKALWMLGKVGPGNVWVKQYRDDIAKARLALRILEGWTAQGGGAADRFPEVAAEAARQGVTDLLQARVSPRHGIHEIGRVLGKEDATRIGQCRGVPPRGATYEDVTWYKYGWLSLGVYNGKVTFISADLSELPPPR